MAANKVFPARVKKAVPIAWSIWKPKIFSVGVSKQPPPMPKKTCQDSQNKTK